MPKRPPKPCNYPGCTRYATTKARCDDHQPEPWATSKNQSRHQRGYGARWDSTRHAVLQRDGHLCQTCKRKGLTTYGNQVDHIVNKAKGGSDDYSNLETICVNCHKKKTAQEASQARRDAQ